MLVTVEIDPARRTAAFREVSYLAAGDSCRVVLDGVRGADFGTLGLMLYRDAASESPAASCASFSAVPGHPSLADGELALDTFEMAEWYADAVPDGESDSDSGPAAPRGEPRLAARASLAERSVRAVGWLVVSDSVRVWAACGVPVLLRPGAGTSGASDPASVRALVSELVAGLVSAALADKADRASPAVAGNLASLDASGNLADSGATPASIKAAAVAEVVANAPGTMDTLKEIADILGSVQQSGTVLKRISDLESGKVDKEAGKGLVAVDAALATQGAAADAKAVGDALAEKASAAGVFMELDGTEVGGFGVPNLSVAGVGVGVVEANGVIDNYAMDAVGNLYVLDTIEWTLDGVAQDDVRMTAENQYTVDGSGDYGLLSPAYGFGSGTGEMAVIDGYSIRIDFSVDGRGVYSPVIVAYDSGGNFDHYVYGGDGGETMPFNGKFSYSFEHGGHAFAMRAKKGAYSFLMTHGKFVREISEGWAESKANKVSSLSAQSTHAQYPSAKCVYDALALKANATDLPYALVEPEPVDEWAKMNEGGEGLVSASHDGSSWSFELADGHVETVTGAASMSYKKFTYGGVEYEMRRYVHHLTNRAVNLVSATGRTTVALLHPARVDGKSRDFYLRVVCTSSQAYVWFAFVPGVVYEGFVSGGSFRLLPGVGEFAFRFTEVAEGVFHVENMTLGNPIDASVVKTGTLDAGRIPGLDAGKIVSGVFPSQRFPLGDVVPPGSTVNMSNLGVFAADGATLSVSNLGLLTVKPEILSYSSAAPLPADGVVTLVDRAVNRVEPTVTAGTPVWTWSDGLAHGTPAYLYDDGYGDYMWGFDDGNGGHSYYDALGNYLEWDRTGDADSEEVSFGYYDEDEGSYVTLTATLETPYVSDVTALALPGPVSGKVRDFMVRLVVPENMPAFAWPANVAYETEDGQMPDVSEPGVYLLAFTESSAGSDRFELFCRKMQEVEAEEEEES